MNEESLSRNEVTIFGERSVAHVEKYNGTYAIVRDLDGVVLCYSDRFKAYIGDIIRTMYTGVEYGSGDRILESDRHGTIHKFK